MEIMRVYEIPLSQDEITAIADARIHGLGPDRVPGLSGEGAQVLDGLYMGRPRTGFE